MRLYSKGLLAFALVIFIAVLTVAWLVGQRAAAEFQTYAALHSTRAQNLARLLQGYYAERGHWEGVLAVLTEYESGPGANGQGHGAGNNDGWSFRVADAGRNIVASSEGVATGQLSPAEIARALPLTVQAELVGYLLPYTPAGQSNAWGDSEQQFLTRLQSALVLGGGAAFVAALLLAGILTRSIVAPVRALTDAAATIAQGDLAARAQVHGRDEIAQLASTFNTMAASLQHAEQSRQTQTSDIAHELRNPLAVLQGTLEALADGVYDPTPENIQPALDQVHTLNRLVEDLRTLALADAGQLYLERQPLDVKQLLSRVVEAHRLPFAEKGLTLHPSIAADLPRLAGDYVRLTQVLDNILGNAMRYVPNGGAIHLTATSEAQGVAIRIADNGPGIPAAALPHLFERFWRGDASRSRATGGSGLGLAIARYIVEAHRGRIWAEPSPGGGLTLAFWLPT